MKTILNTILKYPVHLVLFILFVVSLLLFYELAAAVLGSGIAIILSCIFFGPVTIGAVLTIYILKQQSF